MTTLAIRKKIVDYMQVADDKKVKAVYALLETDIEEVFEYSDELKKQLDEEYRYYKNGGKMITPEEADLYISKILQNRKRK